MKPKGWISIHRQIFENEYLWGDKPFARGQAWIDLLLLVNHDDAEVPKSYGLEIVKRGQRVTSVRALSERWGWSRTKVSDFLKSLKNAEMLDYKSDTKKTVITIVNYDFYQDEARKLSHQNATDKPQKSHKKAQTIMSNNDNKNIYSPDLPDGKIEDNTPKKNKKHFDHNSIPYKSALYIAKSILEIDPDYFHLRGNKYEKALQSWADDIDKILRIDKVSEEELRDVLVFCQNHKFWRKNIKSGAKLREKFGELLFQARCESDE